MVGMLGAIAAITLGSSLVLASIHKLRDLRGFTVDVLEYDVLPSHMARVFGRVLPFAELTCGLALLGGAAPKIAGAFSAMLLLSFLTAVTLNIWRGRTFDCHCFGIAGEQIGWPAVARLLILLSAALVVMSVGDGISASSDIATVVLISAGSLLTLQLIGALPAVGGVWRAQQAASPTAHGGRVSFRGLPLIPLNQALKDRSAEPSRCGGCR
jgi:uncharacterized membrane protein YphA (DoxX/SURF4 family)